jgi:general stress protein CsbA
MSSSRPVSYVRHPRYRWRWLAIALTCLLLASSYYVSYYSLCICFIVGGFVDWFLMICLWLQCIIGL